MKVRDLMTDPVVRIHPEEPVEVAARTLSQYNIGALPVCGPDGRLCGVVTDRDLVVRCMASGRSLSATKVRDVMTRAVVTASPDTDLQDLARLMGQRQVRRLPVVDNGRLCGMVSLSDLVQTEREEAARALARISENVHLEGL